MFEEQQKQNNKLCLSCEISKRQQVFVIKLERLTIIVITIKFIIKKDMNTL